ncbi:MAG TPA: DUF5659 domain-containing protein [Bacteroidales bacterium]|nr:DUF5659 domain-containing protein [Bacteroidales bacterium]
MQKTHYTVFNPCLARKLLKMGYTITDIKPNRELENASIFVFKNQDGLLKHIKNFMASKRK